MERPQSRGGSLQRFSSKGPHMAPRSGLAEKNNRAWCVVGAWDPFERYEIGINVRAKAETGRAWPSPPGSCGDCQQCRMSRHSRAGWPPVLHNQRGGASCVRVVSPMFHFLPAMIGREKNTAAHREQPMCGIIIKAGWLRGVVVCGEYNQ